MREAVQSGNTGKNSILKNLSAFLIIFLAAWVANCLVACQPETKTFRNRLADASSPYLREHADNPVDWYEWSPEALEKAQRENKPLLISIGYASCHWCHVMEEESFMDTAVARIMNDNFVSIKIDREERPDIDQIYISASQLIAGNAGWPLNAFALPDGKPFYVSTYSPKEQWKRSLLQVSEAYKRDTEQITKQARLLTEGVKTYYTIRPPAGLRDSTDQKSYEGIYDAWEPFFDLRAGGLRGAPKFPMPTLWESTLQHYYLTGNRKALDAAIVTLDAMAKGGIFDHLLGGFARYSTDSSWKVPHFEKMLYDNGQMVSLYAHAFQLTGDVAYERVIRKTLNFIATEMTSPEGGFYSSLNADSEGEEGRFYVWTRKEIETLLDENTARLFAEYYNIADGGNWTDGKNILYRNVGERQFAQDHQLTEAQWTTILAKGGQILLDARNKRVHPSRDNKILTGWNSLMLNGYVDAYFATGEKSYLDIAIRNAELLEKNMIQADGRLWRNYIDGKALIDGFLDDYAFLATAYIHLYEATFDAHWLHKARMVSDYAIGHFRDKSTGLFFYTSAESEDLVARSMELADDVMPSSNSAFAAVLFRLGEYFDHAPYYEMVEALLAQIPVHRIRESTGYANWAKLRGLVAFQPYELAVMGPDAVLKSSQIYSHYLPTTILMGGNVVDLPLLEGKLVDGQTIIYVCRNKVCKLPAREVNVALQQLGNRTSDKQIIQ